MSAVIRDLEFCSRTSQLLRQAAVARLAVLPRVAPIPWFRPDLLEI